MELKVTRYEVDADGIATVWFDRPGRGNSWTSRMNAEYRWIMASLDDDARVKVIIVTGAGRQFCVGADFKALDHYVESRNDYVESVRPDAYARPGHGVRPEYDHELIWQWGLKKPVIAAINGACAGIALALVTFCDFRFAVAGAKLTTAAARLGIPAEYGLSWILPRLVGLTHATDILMTARIFTAEEGLRMGLLNDVYPAEEFDGRVRAFARSMARSVSPVSAAITKRQLHADLFKSDPGQAIEDSKALIGKLMKLPDYREGVAALQEKRPPAFAGLDGSSQLPEVV